MFRLLHIIMPLHARKQYPKPWLQHTRGSDGERSPKIFSSEKNKVPDMGGNAVKKIRVPTFHGLCFFPELKWEHLCFFHSISPPCLGRCFFSELKICGLLSPSLPLVCWSQGFGYGVLACNGIIIRTRPNILRTLFRKRAT